LNLLFLLPFVLLGVPFIPVILEIHRRKDEGPREFPEQTTYEEKPNLEVAPTSEPEKEESRTNEEKVSFASTFRQKASGAREMSEPSIPEEKTCVWYGPLPESWQDVWQVSGEGKQRVSSVPMLERARTEARVRVSGEVIRVNGDISIPDGTDVNNHLVVQGTLRLGKKCHVHGTLKVFGNVEIGESSIIDGHVLSEGKILVGRNCNVNGVVDSAQDIILKENAVVEAVSTEKTVKLEPGAKINKRIPASAYITISPAQQPQSTTLQPFEVEISKRIEEEKKSGFQLATPLFVPSVQAKEAGENGEKTVETGTLMADKVLELARRGCDVEEISLRLLIDPSEVQKVLSDLTEKGDLGKDAKTREEAPKKLGFGIYERTRELKTRGVASEETKEEQKVLVGEPDAEQIKEFFERMLASKMREELKKKINAGSEGKGKDANSPEKASRRNR
jgi:cytoskeletal protein CcmA (bactofilin family)